MSKLGCIEPDVLRTRNCKLLLCCSGIAVFVGVILGIYAAAAGFVMLNENEQALITCYYDKEVSNGPGEARFNPFECSASKREAIILSEVEYIKVTNTLTGLITSVNGPAKFFRGAWDEVDEKQLGMQLQNHQYIKLFDMTTGKVRVVRGEQLVFPGAMEEVVQEVSKGVSVDDDTAALILDKVTGQQRLVKEKGLYIPGPYEQVLEERELIRVEPHEVAIVRDVSGSYTFYNGSAGGVGTAFFLPPHSELVTMRWSDDSGVAGQVVVTKIDSRSQYSFFEYTVRTSDNVELVLKGTVFWQILDVPRMIERTGDPKGEVWYHARSALIQAVSGATLEEFMLGFNGLVSAAAQADASFYTDRGVALHTLEVTSYACKDPAQSVILQEIIRETTNRINALQKQRSENEVLSEKLAADLALEVSKKSLVQAKAENDRVLAIAVQAAENEVELAKVTADIELEKKRAELVAAKTANDRVLARSDGEAQGLRYATSLGTFLSEMNDTMARPDEWYRFFSEQEAATEQLEASTKNLGSGSANLILTPQDLNLRLQVNQAGGTAQLSPPLPTAAEALPSPEAGAVQ